MRKMLVAIATPVPTRTPRRTPSVRRLALLPIAAILFGVLAPPAAAQFSSSVPAYQIASKCHGRNSSGDPYLAWRGGNLGDMNGNPYYDYPHGFMYVCYTTYRIGSKTPDGDYYAVDLMTVWDSQPCGFTSPSCAYINAPLWQQVYSNVGAKDGQFNWTPTHPSNATCSTSVDVSFSLGPVSIGTDIKACKGETIALAGQNSKGAYWYAPRAGRVRTIETSFIQKVPHGSIPTFDIVFVAPMYRYEQLGSTLWRITEQYRHYTFSPTGTV